MKKFRLANGLKVLIEKRPTQSVAVEINVAVGSNDESEKLKKSREKVLEIADYIVPGHADMYEVKK